MDIVGARGQYEVGFPEYLLFKAAHQVIEHALAEHVGVPEQHKLGLRGRKLRRDGVEKRVGTVEQDDVGLHLVDDFLQVVIVAEGDVLTGYLYRRGYTVDLDTVDGIHSGDTVLTEAYHIVVESRKALCHVFRYRLYSSLDRMIVFRNLEYSFLH